MLMEEANATENARSASVSAPTSSVESLVPTLPPPVPTVVQSEVHESTSSQRDSAVATTTKEASGSDENIGSRNAISLRPHRRQNAPKEVSKRWLARLASFAHSPSKSASPAPKMQRTSSNRIQSSFDTETRVSSVPADAIPTRPALKIRLVTHNMHDCLSTGDLSDILGIPRSPASRSRQHSTASSSTHLSVPAPDDLPVFPLVSPDGPYHLIVVASQECPTASGVLAGKVRTLNGRGWTSLLEDHLCGGKGIDEDDNEEVDAVGEGDTISHRSATDDHRRGPYVLVEKARLMGIYLAVFCARECETLIEGVSVGRVTAGLIGGRLGNKGAVGISLHIASSRLLFISAHLAAHSHAIDLRKANIQKIFAELEVDDFLASSSKPSHLTDRFDQTFFMGDLNFRLDISRLQADWWCVKTQDYGTALEFDQLRRVLKEPDSVLKGFAEGEITFAPTYKYDVAAKVRKRRSTLLRAAKHVKRTPRDWTAFEPAEVDSGAATDPETLQATQTGDNEDDDALSAISDRESVASGLSDYDRIEKADVPAIALPSSPPKGNVTSMEAVRKAAHVRFLTLVRTNSAAAAFVNAARKANEADRAALAAAEEANCSESDSNISSTQEFGRSSPRRRKLTLTGVPAIPLVRPMLRSSHSELVLPMPRGNIGLDEPDSDAETPPASPSTPGASTDVFAASFDSSAKQRVQSYTDRILFKSTVSPPGDSSSSRRPSGFRESLRGLVQGPAYFDRHRPVLKHAATDGSVSSALRQTRLSTVPDEQQSESPHISAHGLKRAKSLQSDRMHRRASLAFSVKSSKSHDDTGHSFWKRMSSSAKPGQIRSSSAVITTPFNETAKSAALESDGSELRSRKSIFKSKSASSSPVMSRTNTRVMTEPVTGQSSPPSPTDLAHRLSPNHVLRSSSAGQGGSGINRVKSFFHLPLPFLHRTSTDSSGGAGTSLSQVSPPFVAGPLRGEVQVLAYDAVPDLNKMGATSDHRPVYCVLAVGVGGDPVLV